MGRCRPQGRRGAGRTAARPRSGHGRRSSPNSSATTRTCSTRRAAAPPNPSASRCFRGVATALRRADGSLLVVLDDAHDAEPAAPLLLRFLVGALERAVLETNRVCERLRCRSGRADRHRVPAGVDPSSGSRCDRTSDSLTRGSGGRVPAAHAACGSTAWPCRVARSTPAAPPSARPPPQILGRQPQVTVTYNGCWQNPRPRPRIPGARPRLVRRTRPARTASWWRRSGAGRARGSAVGPPRGRGGPGGAAGTRVAAVRRNVG